MDLSKILKGREGEQFWSAIFGYITLKHIEQNGNLTFNLCSRGDIKEILYDKAGRLLMIMWVDNQLPTLFPSKENQNWEKWEKEHPAVEQYKIGQYVKKDLSRYQITNITEKVVIICNIKTGEEVVITKDDINRYINKKELTVINNIKNILEPFDTVLIKFRENGPWRLDFYSHFDGEYAHCINRCVTKEHILPYYPNKYLFDNGTE